MIDPDLKYCPKCKDEYRADIELCAACGIVLLLGSDMMAVQNQTDAMKNSRKGAILPGEDIIPIHKGALNELKAIEKELESENIGSLINKEGGGCSSSC